MEYTEDDLDFAFELQLQEALNFSLLEPKLEPTDTFSDSDPQTLELVLKFEQERKDAVEWEAEMRRIRDDLKIQTHDHNFAEEILQIPEDEWVKYGNKVEKPFGEASSSSGEVFRLYFKGLFCDEIAAIGAAVCDGRDNLILNVQKDLSGDWKSDWEEESLQFKVEVKALMEGLNAAISLDIKKIDIFCDFYPLYHYIINHGVTEEVMHNMKDTASSFFNHSFDEKNKYAMSANDVQGYGHAYVMSEEQKLDWTDLLFLIIYPSNFRKLDYWPTSPPELIEAIETYSTEVNKVAQILLSAISVMIGMEKDSLLEMHKEVMQALRVNYYPTCSLPELVLGVSPHSDTSSITILMQDDDVTGLQIRHKGEWVSVRPIPNTFVVNIGDVIEIWSNGKYRSIEHRAVTNKDNARMSFVSFVTPNQDVEIEPLEQMVDVENPVKLYKKIKYGDYLRSSLKKKHEGKEHTKVAKYETE